MTSQFIVPNHACFNAVGAGIEKSWSLSMKSAKTQEASDGLADGRDTRETHHGSFLFATEKRIRSFSFLGLLGSISERLTSIGLDDMTSPTGMQAMMAYWERLHAINAVHIAEVSYEISRTDLQAAGDRLFRKFFDAEPGGWPTLSANHSAEYHQIKARFDALPQNNSHPLEGIVTNLLNEPFGDDEPPFRYGLAENSRVRYLWLTYRHSIADSRSVAMLLQNLQEELAWTGYEELPLGIERTKLSLLDFFPQEACRTNLLRSLGPSINTLWKLNRCHRRPPADPTDFEMTFQVHADHLPLTQVRQRAKQLNSTVGELVTAAMLDWFIEQDRPLPRNIFSPNRCVSVMADLAGRAEPKRLHLFGQFLSPLNISANSYRQWSFEELVQNVSQSFRDRNSVTQNLRTLRGLRINSFLAQQLNRSFANAYQEFLFPVSGALSNVQMSSVLPPPRTPLSVDNYIRGTCATQFSPMILCFTTIKDHCTVTSSHRSTVYTNEEMRDLADHIMNRAFGVVAGAATVQQIRTDDRIAA